MEIGVQGRTSDFLFTGYQNIAKMLELCVTGGYCLIEKKQLKYVSPAPLTEFDTYDDFYASFISEVERMLVRNLEYQDMLSAHVEKKRPAYLISSMVNDCLARGRNMHGGGARYHDYGSALVAVPNAADALTAIKIAVFDEKICTASELVEALKANFEGYEALHAKLLALPKYGQENELADSICAQLCVDLNRIYSSYVNRFGGNGKLVMLTFIWAPAAGAILGATPDGRKAGIPIAHSMTPQSMSMTKGITAAINSCTSLPFELFNGGASTMWDLDPNLAKSEIVSSLFMTFFEQGGQIFQGNMTDVEELKEALKCPDQYKHLIVRVGGYSSRFVTLHRSLQQEIINRMRHSS
jgi:formate C-acetyltransferase